MTREIVMPRLSEDMDRGRVQEWLKQPGDTFERGEPLVSIESEKVTLDVEAPESGVMLRIMTAEGDEVEVGTVLAIIGLPGESVDDVAERDGVSAQPSAGHETAVAADEPGPAPGRPTRRPSSPAARRRAREAGIDLESVVGTGPDGLVTEADVAGHLASNGGTRAPELTIPLTGVRRRIADRMSASRREIADVTTVAEVDMAAVIDDRTRTGASFLAYTVAAAARTLLEFPLLNASLLEDRIVVHSATSIGVAVATDKGLVVPVVRDAAARSVGEISAEIDRLGARARSADLAHDEISGATFTITNSGAFGSLFFTPIINLPQVAILGMGKVHDAAVVQAGAVVAGKRMYLCLSYDHRVIDGKVAVEFLQAVRQRLERPSALAIP